MIENSRDFRKQHPDILAARRCLYAQQFFYRQGKRVFLTHWRDIIEAIEIRNRLQVRLVLDQFFGAAMKQSHVRIRALDNLAVHLKHQAQNAMRRRMLRTKI